MIREANTKDVASLAALALHVWLNTYTVDGMRKEYADFAITQFTKEYFETLLACEHYHVLVYEKTGAILGFAIANLDSFYDEPSNGYELEKLYVHSHFQGKGIGKALIKAIEQHCGNPFWLYTWAENKSNVFYQRLGFKQVGEFKFDFAGATILNYVYVNS
ncbi:GNAT family N-acetyltransferase [Pseudoalteromonas luteoviolacea]|uniref:N-acetyltransferase domain-containing protein n=1 Tax=Pseudoalteromonas luteoviolacea DSM 6061 TaxID=1365250 RepID=A0A166WU09_9GAMM|nr:GNAT family N-acetyltransferase [Pseudoalteromonas luteoviolacea]KZN38076.1 hypothetical protein N475_15725 [Pseudoalteromonas luteoviolacea DSM 6061]KZN54439.1 hypothetical protein N474_01610 [Pseudoalteromonas luteoviolacea CPMOR-2]MBE0388905.1 hypothetical protein [Pseudoalteromonas luteoviolacea DSM 6061]TQF70279.1 GNAT family N-acetyltransferase [Pseudoalteromonas luteoviolacea]